MEIKTEWGYDDLNSALNNNSPATFNPHDIIGLVAEVPGANEEYNWWWIIQIKIDNIIKYVLMSAWCDYTGWDCQSGINEEQIFDTVMECVNICPENEIYSGRNIKQNLLMQVQGEQPFGLYDSKYEKGE
jgi:hypothetical protein